MKLLSNRRLPIFCAVGIVVMMLSVLAALPSSAVGAAVLLDPASSKSGPEENNPIATYWVGNVSTKEDRTAIARAGAE
jgi:hypothetical protein